MKSRTTPAPEPASWHQFSAALRALLSAYRLQLCEVAGTDGIPGSFWGDSEAGLLGQRLYVRADTPLHSALHEAGHFICMDVERRAGLDTNAGGDYDEENAVCYLQAIMADRISGYGRLRLFSDMDAWGYSFRLGSAQAWFEQDADDAREWLIARRIITADELLTGNLRGQQ